MEAPNHVLSRVRLIHLDEFGGQTAHDLCAPAGMINIENLTNLGNLPRVGTWFQAFPLKLSGTEASPVRALAWVEPA